MCLLRKLMFWNNYLHFLNFVALSIAVDMCPDISSDVSNGNTTNGTYCFADYYYEVANLRHNFQDAKSYCQSKGQDVVSIQSDSEYEFLYEILHAMNATWLNRVWSVGNTFTGYVVMRFDGTIINSVKWNEYKPHGFPYNFPEPEGCNSLHILTGINYEGHIYLEDEECYRKLNFICKRKVVTISEKNLTVSQPSSVSLQSDKCQRGWRTFRNNCYLPIGRIQNNWSSFKSAQENCNLLDGNLASIENEEEQVFLTFLMQNIEHRTWIGFHATTKYGPYSWLNQSSVPAIYTNWADKEPSIFGPQEKCVYMQYDSHEMGQWKDSACDVKMPYICKANKNIPDFPLEYSSTQCTDEDDWFKQGDSCFKIINESKSWIEAQHNCEQLGANLISISDISVQSTFKYLSIDLNAPSWIGLTVNSNYKFQWINGLPLNISNWDKNQPATKGKKELCFVSSSDGFWNVSSCEILRPFICQKSIEKQPEKESNSNISVKTDVSSSVFLDEKFPCYKILIDRDITFAFMDCHMIEGKISGIHSRNQVEFLKNSLKKSLYGETSFHTGLFRNKRGGFAWADGSPVDFEYWDEGEPRDLINKNCVEMTAKTLKWRVASCLSKQSMICNLKRDSFRINNQIVCPDPYMEQNFAHEETSQIPLNINTKSSVTRKVPQLLTTESSFSTVDTEMNDTHFIDNNNLDPIQKSLELYEKSSYFTHDSHSSLSSSALAGILVSVTIIAVILLGVYFYFNHHAFKCLQKFSSQKNTSENVVYCASTGLEIQEDQDVKVSYTKLTENE